MTLITHGRFDDLSRCWPSMCWPSSCSAESGMAPRSDVSALLAEPVNIILFTVNIDNNTLYSPFFLAQ